MNIHSSNDLDYIITKLEDVYQEVSGKSLRKQQILDSDEFLKQASFINTKIVRYRKAQKMRDDMADEEGSEGTVSRIKATQKLKEMLKELKIDVDELRETLNR